MSSPHGGGAAQRREPAVAVAVAAANEGVALR
jgi:hypothetical protein